MIFITVSLFLSTLISTFFTNFSQFKNKGTKNTINNTIKLGLNKIEIDKKIGFGKTIVTKYLPNNIIQKGVLYYINSQAILLIFNNNILIQTYTIK